jgi:hypothetical protein
VSTTHVTVPMARVREICAEVGFDLDGLAPSLLARLELLAAHSETVADTERMIARAWAVFRHQAELDPSSSFTEIERRIVVLGCLFSDIGKTGPAGADISQQTLIVEMFAVEGVRDETQTVGSFFLEYFPADAAERTRRFQELGLDPGLTMRQFWNLHSGWTLEIAERGGVPPEVIAAAATHHLLDNVNPAAIVAPDQRFTRAFGDNAAFDRAEKLVILLDKYDALRRRAGRSHAATIRWLRQRVDENVQFRGDAELVALISGLDSALAREQTGT